MPAFEERDLRKHFGRVAGVNKDGEYVFFRCNYCDYKTFLEEQMFAHLLDRHQGAIRDSAKFVGPEKD